MEMWLPSVFVCGKKTKVMRDSKAKDINILLLNECCVYYFLKALLLSWNIYEAHTA